MMERKRPARTKAIALACALGAGLVAPGVLWAADEVPPGSTAPQPPSATTTAPATPPEPPTTSAEPAPPPSPPDSPPSPRADSAAAPAKTAAAKPPPLASSSPATARAAASGGVTIQGFAFHPGSLTVNVGDTVSWTNSDSASHTATADDGSFDTGTLRRGQSGSHTFNRAGTFSYICTIHPNMHGTITVVAASSGSGSSGSSGSGSSGSGSSAGTTGTASSGSSSGSSLPSTGLQLGAVALLGLALLGAGGLLRRLSARLSRDSES